MQRTNHSLSANSAGSVLPQLAVLRWIRELRVGIQIAAAPTSAESAPWNAATIGTNSGPTGTVQEAR